MDEHPGGVNAVRNCALRATTSLAHAGLIPVSAKAFPQDRSFTAAITSALSALLDQTHAIRAGQVLFLARP